MGWSAAEPPVMMREYVFSRVSGDTLPRGFAMSCHYVAQARRMAPGPWVSLRFTHGYSKVTATRSQYSYQMLRSGKT